MNTWLAAAAAVAFATFLIHTFVGGREIARPLLAARDLPRIPRLTAYYCWHMVTILLLAMSAALGWTAAHANTPLAVLMLVLALAFTALSLALVVAYRVRPWYLPQWSLFAAIAALTGLGLA
ncbi:MAG TPA: hypothetical protein VLF18_18945 [Tahibacter sp.]|uniref:hypothetical protein n=1 Tax=Tahibacter sp. TaxID=2056211 RepID=UPI002C0CF78D|nr:hypothetical protein [Tahibacter sp.]HSX62266.1 hypothetical protein [Tahibacter sp.]